MFIEPYKPSSRSVEKAPISHPQPGRDFGDDLAPAPCTCQGVAREQCTWTTDVISVREIDDGSCHIAVAENSCFLIIPTKTTMIDSIDLSISFGEAALIIPEKMSPSLEMKAMGSFLILEFQDSRNGVVVGSRPSIAFMAEHGSAFVFPSNCLAELSLAVTRQHLINPSIDESADLIHSVAVLCVAELRRQIVKSERQTHQGFTKTEIELLNSHVNQHLQRKITIDDLAEICHCSKFQLIRRFKCHFGRTPHQHIIRERVKKACDLLDNTAIPIAHIAHECGFSSQSHLSTVFVKDVGETPLNYRARIHTGGKYWK